ncbi:hypothetical protein TrVE_jg6006 [Triparma verrucosa]|uniref:Transmembrane protein n=1 Tax=Triparma verrucosa TaxID=1606542 RepID=A0A9W7BHE1_9STRA|nr:hypothetical protein TrVE_jg6006 [Triparma verrucosa]
MRLHKLLNRQKFISLVKMNSNAALLPAFVILFVILISGVVSSTSRNNKQLFGWGEGREHKSFKEADQLF